MTDSETLKKLEEELWRPETRYGRRRMSELFADDFYEIGRSGRKWTRDELVASEPTQFDAELPLPDFAVQMLAPTVALVTYCSRVRYGESLLMAHRVSVWTKIGDAWKLRFHQGTPYENDA